jgi:hypothetical protein
VKPDNQRCNHCMSEFSESLFACPVCGRDDALMYPLDTDGERSSEIRYEAQGVWHNRAFTTQRCDWYAVHEGDKTYAFHEWTFFPHFGAVMAAAISGTEAEVRQSFWLEGWAQSADELLAVIQRLGLEAAKYGTQECPYGPGVFPVCTEFDDAVRWFEASTAAAESLERGET